MAADNLTVQITADSSKLRADLSLAQAELRKLQKELRAASDAGDKERVAQLSAEYEGLAAQIRKTSRALSDHNKEIAVSKRNWSEMAIGVKEAVAAFAALAGVRRVVDIFRDVTKSITELRNTAKAAALSPGDVKVFQEVVEDTGESADGARQALVNLTDQIAQARIKAKGFGQDLVAGVNVMRGGQGGGSFSGDDFGVNIVRGGQAAAKSVDELTQKILDNAAKFKDNRRSIQSVLEDLGKLRQRDAALATAVGVQLLGKKYALFAEAIDRLGKKNAWEEVKKQLEEQGRLPTAEAVQRVEDYNKAVDDVGDAFEALRMAIAIPLLPNVAAGIGKFAELIQNIDQLKAKYQEFRDAVGLIAIEDAIAGPIRRGLTSALDAVRAFADSIPGPISASFRIMADLLQVTVSLITGDLSGAMSAFGQLATDVWNSVIGLVYAFGDAVKATISGLGSSFTWLWDQINAAWAALQKLFASAPVATAPIPQAPAKATGGMIRGRGTSTSDSILARLSNGEFVVRASAVRHWGVGFLSALNSYAGGGPVGFASGGAVSKSLETASYNTAQIGAQAANFPEDLAAQMTGITSWLRGFASGILSAADASNKIINDAIKTLANVGMAAGGLVGGGSYLPQSTIPMRAFADGGMVGSGGGTPVHLHLGGHSFALTAGADVVQSLAHEARRYQLRSAGTKPSWYGGTPGGR